MSTSSTKVALVTGGNKGIGFEIARRLGKEGCVVLLGSRDKKRGQAAVTQLKGEGIDTHLVILDVTHVPSIQRAVQYIESEYGHLDILVNNAGMAHDASLKPSETPLETIREVFETNFFGTVAVTQEMLPLLRKSSAGRIVNVSSSAGSLGELSGLDGGGGWMPFGYDSSKTALNSFTVHLAIELRDTPIKVNSACPGWCRTDMGGAQATCSAEEGADTPVWLATLPADGPSGGFFSDRKPVPW